MICFGGPLNGYDFRDSCPVESDGFRYLGPARNFRYEPIGDMLFFVGTVVDTETLVPIEDEIDRRKDLIESIRKFIRKVNE